jgi:RNA polymerase sigma-70 factor (family 1)
LPGTPQHSEQELLRLIAKGDEVAFATLFNNYRNKIYSIAYELTESTIISEEIVQDTFLKIWLKRETLEDITHFKAYLFTITRNYVFSALKSIARKQNLELKVVQNIPVYHSDTENNLVQKEYDEILKRAVDSLPPKQRQVYVLMKENGYKRHEVAAKLQLSEETVKTHLAQAMRAIRAYCLAHIDTLLPLLALMFLKIR